MCFTRQTWAEINLNQLKNNINLFKKITGKNKKILIPVKANAYGHGILPISKFCEKLQVDYLCTATTDEGILLKKNDIKTPIIIFGALLKNEIHKVIENNLELTLSNKEMLKNLIIISKKMAKKINVHINIDTGMGRVGILPQNIDNILNDLIKNKNINIKSIYTHFPVSDFKNINSWEGKFTINQIKKFNEIIPKFKKLNQNIFFHTANSGAILNNIKESFFDAVRPGISTYGLHPNEQININENLKEILSLKSKIIYIKKIKKGNSVSYGCTWKAKRESIIATIPIGYGDGYSRDLSNTGKVIIKNKYVPIVGRVSMDMTMLDITLIPEIKIGDTVILYGKSKNKSMFINDIASQLKTIPHTVTCGLNQRIPRVYLT